jgi:hypothetical protein
MWVGHYAAALALKAAAPRTSLPALFLAVQALDIISVGLVLLGLEHWRVVPGLMAASSLDLDVPYSHGLLSSLGLALTTALVALLLGARPALAAILATAVWSHFWLDAIVHRPDLPLYDHRFPIGLGLWNNIAASFALESALLVAGLVLYLRATRARGLPGRVFAPLVVALMIAADAKNLWQTGPPATEFGAVAVGAASYAVFALVAAGLDRVRDE